MIGRKLSHYEVLEKIGSGGMGEVYLAKDTKLDRRVALKVLPPELADSEERRARFQREAKAIAALNHPNIVHVYSVEEADGVHFITMELVEGKTLRKQMGGEALLMKDTLRIATEMAEGLARRLPGIRIELWDERLTTVQAERTMIAGNVQRRKRRERVDSLAATLILQNWLDAQAFERTDSD